MTRKMLFWATFVLISLSFLSCKKGSNTGTPGGSRTVKYELTGTYSGTLSGGYTNQDGAFQLIDNIRLPWSIEVTVKGSGSQMIALSAGSEVGGFGQAGETMTGKISVGGQVKKEVTVNSTSSGYIDLGGMAYELP